MKIDKAILSEKNYEGSRFIEVKATADLKRLFKELEDIRKEAGPLLEESDKIYPIVDPYYKELGVIQGEMQKAQDDFQTRKSELRAKYINEVTRLEEIDLKMKPIEVKSNMIKNKLMPIILDEVKDQLGEFEVAFQTKEKDGKVFVEVQDKIEELVKSLRAQKAKK
jgi:hypothetical protein